MRERYLVTGANGCIGAWTVQLLLADGCDVISFDLGTDEHRHRLINSGQLPDIEWCQGDITNPEAVAEVVARCDRVIHLAALQVPFCRADPSRGAEVNVKGTVNVFQAALTHDVPHLVQASSIAVYGANGDYPNPIVPPDAPRLPIRSSPLAASFVFLGLTKSHVAGAGGPAPWSLTVYHRKSGGQIELHPMPRGRGRVWPCLPVRRRQEFQEDARPRPAAARPGRRCSPRAASSRDPRTPCAAGCW